MNTQSKHSHKEMIFSACTNHNNNEGHYFFLFDILIITTSHHSAWFPLSSGFELFTSLRNTFPWLCLPDIHSIMTIPLTICLVIGHFFWGGCVVVYCQQIWEENIQ